MDHRELEQCLSADTYEFFEKTKDISDDEWKDLVRTLHQKIAGTEQIIAALDTFQIEPVLKAADTTADLAEKLILMTQGQFGVDEMSAALLARRNFENPDATPAEKEKVLCGTLADQIRKIEKKILGLKTPKGESSLGMLIVLGVIGIGLAALLFFHPGTKDFFNGEWVDKGAVAIGALIIIGSLFAGGLVTALVVAVVLAMLFSFLSSAIGLGVLLRVVLAGILGLVGIGCAFAIPDEFKKKRHLPTECLEAYELAETEYKQLKFYIEALAEYTKGGEVGAYYQMILKRIRPLEGALDVKYFHIEKSLK